MTYAVCDGVFPCVCVIVVGQFQILSGTKRKSQEQQFHSQISGHNIANIVSTALLQSKVPRQLVEKFANEFNRPALEKEG